MSSQTKVRKNAKSLSLKTLCLKFFHMVHVILCLAILSLLLAGFLAPAIQSSADITRFILLNLNQEWLEWSLVSYATYYVAVYAVLLALYLYFVCYWFYAHRHIKRDDKYIQHLFESENKRLPLAAQNEEGFSTVRDNVRPIISFINGSVEGGNTLVVDAPWGAGKTTSVLLAINNRETKLDDVTKSKDDATEYGYEYRYIYESAFKYTGNTGEYGRDLISALHDTLSELGLYYHHDFTELAQNVELSTGGLAVSLGGIMHNMSRQSLTTDLVRKINDRYDKNKDRFWIIIILDDIDRLQKEDAFKALSLLSILRRLKFVKIIVPADMKKLAKALTIEAEGKDGNEFIQKYLPGLKAHELKTDAENTRKIVMQRIREMQEGESARRVDLQAAWAVIVLKLTSDRINKELPRLQNYHMKWLSHSLVDLHELDKLPSSVATLLKNGRRSIDRAIHKANSQGAQYRWSELAEDADIRNFEQIISYMSFAKTGNPLVLDNFRNTEYDALVESWVLTFADDNWELIDVTLRDILDLVDNYDLSQLKLGRAKQFQQVFNIFFPKIPYETMSISNDNFVIRPSQLRDRLYGQHPNLCD